jgi:hypothetical protein
MFLGRSGVAAVVTPFFAGVVLSLGAEAQPEVPAQEVSISVSVDDPRPLAAALRAFEQRLGVAITYEDPPWRHVTEYKDVTATVARTVRRGQPPTLVPRGGPLSVFVRLAPMSASDQALSAVEALLVEYRAAGYPGDFRVIRSDSVLHVVPTTAKDARGVVGSFVPVLSSRVSIDDRERTAREMIDAIQDKSQGVLWVAGTPAQRILIGTRILGGATDETMRSVLLQTIRATGRNLSWHVYCGPTGRLGCALNIHLVEPVVAVN